MRPEEALKLALHAPNSRNVVISACQEAFAIVAPLNGRDEMVVISSLRHLRLICHAYMPQLHPRGLRRPRQFGECLCVDPVEVPDVNKAVSSPTSGQNLLVRVPL